MNFVDANVILRCLLQDAVQFLDQAREIIENHSIFIPNEVIAEVVYVLEKVYSEIKIDFVDSLLFSYSKIGEHTIFTFDKKLNQLLEELRNSK